MSDEKLCTGCAQIKELMDAKLAAHNVRMDSIQEGISLARKEMEHRLMLLNELRREVTEDRGRFVAKDSYEVKAGEIDRSITSIRQEISNFRANHVTNDLYTNKMKELDRALSHNWTSAVGIVISILTALGVIVALATSR